MYKTEFFTLHKDVAHLQHNTESMGAEICCKRMVTDLYTNFK